jgi:ribosomal protein S18 acetylase RimI-like enzyme
MSDSGMEIRLFRDEDERRVAALWTQVFGDTQPHNDPVNVIRQKRAYQGDLFWVAVDENQIVGAVMGGYDGHRGWIYSLAVDREHRRRGIGTALICQVEKAFRDLGCSKVNLQVRESNGEVITFYEKLGYSVEERVSMGRLLTD